VESVTNGTVPVPVKATHCGDPAALSVIVRLAMRGPVAVGLNVTVTTQVDAGAMLLPTQVVVLVKSPLLAPPIFTALTVSGPVPLLVIVTVWLALAVVMFWLPNARLAVESVAPGTVPVPLSATACGDVAALSAIVKLAERFPAIVGANVTVIVQVAAGAILLPMQVFVLLKSAPLVPATVTALTVNAAFPLLVIVIAWPALVVPIFWLANVRLTGESMTPGASAIPRPLSATDCGESAALSVIERLAERFPAAVGVNVTVTMQVPPAAMLLPTHVFVLLKSPAWVPVTLTTLTVKAAFPLFVTVTLWLALVELTF
jgi:hypothetical protein